MAMPGVCLCDPSPSLATAMKNLTPRTGIRQPLLSDCDQGSQQKRQRGSHVNQTVGPGHLLEVAARQRKKERVHRASPPRSRLPGPDLLEVIAF